MSTKSAYWKWSTPSRSGHISFDEPVSLERARRRLREHLDVDRLPVGSEVIATDETYT